MCLRQTKPGKIRFIKVRMLGQGTVILSRRLKVYPIPLYQDQYMVMTLRTSEHSQLLHSRFS